jgi:hypothetical protein
MAVPERGTQQLIRACSPWRRQMQVSLVVIL